MYPEIPPIDGSARERSLRNVLTPREPLGPHSTEPLLSTREDVFRELYDETNHIHRSADAEDPSYIIGRKGAGKTAFLHGAAVMDGADVVLLTSEDLYGHVARLAHAYEDAHGPLVADNLVHVWEVLLFHGAMWAMSTSSRTKNGSDKHLIWNYMSALGDPFALEADALLARVSGLLSGALVGTPSDLSFREACWAIGPRGGAPPLRDAADAARRVQRGQHGSIYVVVDNLEDLHNHLDRYASVVSALFRVVSRNRTKTPQERLPFRLRFAFPAELLPNLRTLAANPEKDFVETLVIRWTASELIVLAGNRLRTFLDLYYPDAYRSLRLPRSHDPADQAAAADALRAFLPEADITNMIASREDPVAYVMRHTQLLPRHLIRLLNVIIAKAVSATPADRVPRATAEQVVAGVNQAERTIVDGILSTYEYRYPRLGEAFATMKNHCPTVLTVSGLHQAFNRAGARRTGWKFQDYLRACLTVGAFGVVDPDATTPRYVVGNFSYTLADEVRPIEDTDEICVHPLFMSKLFDVHAVRAMAKRADTRPVYPYGSDPEHHSVET